MAIDQIKINSTAYDIGASASNISFNKNGTSLDATNVQSAIVEIDGDISALDNNKVDKVNGKGLSTNDFTDAAQTKLSGIEIGAQVNTITGVKGSAEQDYRIGNVSISKTDIGLANVDNTSDVNKPISTATQNALNNKVDKVTGKGLSTEDYTTAEKDKLGTVSEYANHVNVTRYGTEGTKIATISCDGIDTDIYASGSGGSGGHTILDDNGDALTQRGEMQFVGTYSEDDSTNEITKVNIVREMTKAEFDLLSDDEKTGIIVTTDEETYSGQYGETILLSTPTSLGSGTSITLSDDYTNYDAIYIDFEPVDSGYSIYRNCLVRLISDVSLNTTYVGYSVYDSGNFGFTYKLTNSNTFYGEAISPSSRNMKINKIVGIKFGGASSGSDEIYSTDEMAVGTWIDGSTIYQKTVNIGKIISTGEKVYTLGIENVDYLVDVRITPLLRANEANLYTLDNYNPSWSAGSYTSVAMNNDPTVGLKITIYSGYYTSANDIYVTVQYTKLTT